MLHTPLLSRFSDSAFHSWRVFTVVRDGTASDTSKLEELNWSYIVSSVSTGNHNGMNLSASVDGLITYTIMTNMKLYILLHPLSHGAVNLHLTLTQINVYFLWSHVNKILDLNLGSKPGCEVVLNLHSLVNQGLIALFDMFAVL